MGAGRARFPASSVRVALLPPTTRPRHTTFSRSWPRRPAESRTAPEPFARAHTHLPAHNCADLLYQAASTTVAILAQGTSWADAATQASFDCCAGSSPGRSHSQANHHIVVCSAVCKKKMFTLLGLCVSSLRNGHATFTWIKDE